MPSLDAIGNPVHFRPMPSDNPEVVRILAHVAGFHATVANAFAAGLPPTGWGLQEVMDYSGQYIRLRERLREADPGLFGDLTVEGYSASILSRHDLLRQLILESHGVLVTAHHLGLCAEPPPLQLPAPKRTPRGFVQRHLVEIVVGVIVAVAGGGLLFFLGWK